MEKENKKIYWTASNNSTFLNGHREAKNMLCAVRDGRRYLRYELYGEGSITFYDDPECEQPIRQDTKNIFTGHKWEITTIF